MKSIMSNMDGLAGLNGELIWSEMKKMLMEPNRYECIEAFFECGGAVCLGK